MKQGFGNSRVLATIGALFLVGNIVRWIPSGVANANQTDLSEPETAQAEVKSAPQAQATATNAEPGDQIQRPAALRPSTDESACLTEDFAAMLDEDRWLFLEKEAEFKDKFLTLEAKAQSLRALEADLVALESTLASRWAEMQEQAKGERQHLSRMYVAMKPDEAAAIFDQMAPGLASDFLNQMPSEQAGSILASMDPALAYKVSLELASRYADILPDEE